MATTPKQKKAIRDLQALGIEIPSALKAAVAAGFKIFDDGTVILEHSDIHGKSLIKNIWLFPDSLAAKKSDAYGGSDEPVSHYPLRGANSLLLCENLVDALLVAQILKKTGRGLAYTVVVSTSRGTYPKEWGSPLWWRQWSKVQVVGTSDYAREILARARRDLFAQPSLFLNRDLRIDLAPEWIEAWLAGGALLANTFPAAAIADPDEDSDLEEPEELDHEPINIQGAFQNNYLYYCATKILRTGGQESLIKKILKSDRTSQEIRRTTSPAAGSAAQIYRLTDGTQCLPIRDHLIYPTWSARSMRSFQSGRFVVRPLHELLADIVTVLRSQVWLPNPEDYTVSALAVVVSYVQSIFDAVPLLLGFGPPDSGKSQLGLAMKSVAANAVLVDEVSAATLAREADASCGFMVIDDSENLSTKQGEQDVFSQVVQLLKRCYKKETAFRAVTQPNGEVVRHSTYGVKYLNNTRGLGGILRTRTLIIRTAAMPAGTVLPPSPVMTRALRDDLHTWAFSSVGAVVTEKERLGLPRNRRGEITLPLRTIANLSGIDSYKVDLETHLNPPGAPTAAQVANRFKEFVQTLVLGGLTELCPVDLVDPFANELGTMPDCLTPEWLGTQLGKHPLIHPKPARFRRNGQQLRKYLVKSKGRASLQNPKKRKKRGVLGGADTSK